VIVWHVTSAAKLNKYLRAGQINAPVRAWQNLEQAGRMSLSSGRRVILRLRFPDDAPPLPGHFGLAVYIDTPYKLEGI
jgi:hypothetical protein